MNLFVKVLTSIQNKDNEKKRLKVMKKEQHQNLISLIVKWCEFGMPSEAIEELEVSDEFSYLTRQLKRHRHDVDDNTYERLVRMINIRQLNRQREEIQQEIVKISRSQKVFKASPSSEECETSM
jgi:hypothetical protein